MRNIRIVFACLATMGLVACVSAPKGNHSPRKALEAKLGSYKAVSVQVSGQGDGKEFAPKLQDRVLTSLSPRFQTVQAEKPDLVIKLKITEAKTVSWFSRFFLGIMAGEDRLRLVGELVDPKTNRVIGSFDAVGEYNGSNIFNGAGIDYAIDEATKEVDKYVASNM